MQKIKLIKMEPSKLSNEITEFGPIECMDCEFDGVIPLEYFLVSPDIETDKEYNELRKLVKSELGYDSFTETGHEDGLLISVCRCPKCCSEEIFQDF